MRMKKLLALLTAALLAAAGCVTALGEELSTPEEEPVENIPAWVVEQEVAMAAALSPAEGLPVKSAVLMEQNPEAVGGELPDDDFYFSR